MFSTLAPVEEWMGRQRDQTFHYPVMLQVQYEHGGDAFGNALDAAADDTSSATVGETLRETRFDFADAVGVHWLGFKLPEQEDEFKRLVEALREANYALGVFVLAAVAAYLQSLPPGRISSQANPS
ncbi:MAG: hypothetical protein C5B48_12025 [Candidatus Rokuibacteriota bacterium]|nr:MAG: hypothetical protein C5B48_12025 [Candidatus Rokubacteria bacterium]